MAFKSLLTGAAPVLREATIRDLNKYYVTFEEAVVPEGLAPQLPFTLPVETAMHESFNNNVVTRYPLERSVNTGLSNSGIPIHEFVNEGIAIVRIYGTLLYEASIDSAGSIVLNAIKPMRQMARIRQFARNGRGWERL